MVWVVGDSPSFLICCVRHFTMTPYRPLAGAQGPLILFFQVLSFHSNVQMIDGIERVPLKVRWEFKTHQDFNSRIKIHMVKVKPSVRKEEALEVKVLCRVWKICNAKSPPIAALPNGFSGYLLIFGAVFKDTASPSEISFPLNSLPHCKTSNMVREAHQRSRKVRLGLNFRKHK